VWGTSANDVFIVATTAPSRYIRDMRFASIAVTSSNVDVLLKDTADAVLNRLGEHADVAFVFVNAALAPRAESLAANLKRAIGARVMIGCTGEGVIGPAHEIEDQPRWRWSRRRCQCGDRPFAMKRDR
jgi:hypothetical protein